MKYDRKIVLPLLKEAVEEFPEYIKTVKDVFSSDVSGFTAELYFLPLFYGKLTRIWPKRCYDPSEETKVCKDMLLAFTGREEGTEDILESPGFGEGHYIKLKNRLWMADRAEDQNGPLCVSYEDYIGVPWVDLEQGNDISPEAIVVLDDMLDAVDEYIPQISRMVQREEFYQESAETATETDREGGEIFTDKVILDKCLEDARNQRVSFLFAGGDDDKGEREEKFWIFLGELLMRTLSERQKTKFGKIRKEEILECLPSELFKVVVEHSYELTLEFNNYPGHYLWISDNCLLYGYPGMSWSLDIRAGNLRDVCEYVSSTVRNIPKLKMLYEDMCELARKELVLWVIFSTTVEELLPKKEANYMNMCEGVLYVQFEDADGSTRNLKFSDVKTDTKTVMEMIQSEGGE